MATIHEQSSNGLSSIPLPEIPVKLRCTMCSELARGASRLPCCEQSICESCHTNHLPNVCPVCDHSPLSPDDCKANTALRTTVAVFLRTAEKKHNLLQQKEQKEKAKPTEPKAEVKNVEPEPDKTVQTHVSPVQNPLTPPQEVEDSARTEGQQAVSQASPEHTEAIVAQVPAKAHDATPVPDAEQTNGFADQQNPWFNQQNPSQMGMQQMQQMQQMFPGHDFSGPNGWNVYNQMMQEMQGGWMNGYGNIMDYPMNSVVAQGGGFVGGFGGMGMNGAGGFHNGHDGMGWGAWNGQNNVGFNPGMEGTRNGGYYSAASAGGYNHQSHGNLQMPTQQYQNHHFQRQQPYPRGGRGGFVGGARQYSHERQQQQAFQDAQFSQQLQGIDEAVAAVVSSGDEKKGEKIPSVVSGDPENIADPNDVPTDTASTVLAGAGLVSEDLADSLNPAAPVNSDMAQYFPLDDFRGPGFQPQFYPPRGGFRGNFRGGYRGDFGIGPRGGGAHNIAPILSVLGDPESDKIPGVGLGVEGAPTGPKALREGIPPVRGGPIRGGTFGRGRGVYAGSSWTRSISPGHVRIYSRSRSRRRSSVTGRDRSRDPSRDRRRNSRSRNRDRSRHHKQRSQSVGSDGEHRGRTPKCDGEETTLPTQDKELAEIVTGELDNTDFAQPASAVRSKRSREDSGSRGRGRSVSRSRSRSADRHHKRSRRDRDRRAGQTTESRDRDREGRGKESKDKENREKEGRDKDGSSRHHRRSHKHKTSRRHRSRSRSRSRSPKRDDYPVEDKGTARDVDGVDGRRKDSRERERRHKRRSKREESRHRSHRHKSSRHERHDRQDKDDKYERDEKHDRDERHDRKDKLEKSVSDVIEKKIESHRHSEKDSERKSSLRDSRSRRKPSYKYEDEEDLERRAERDREAERWSGVKK